MVARAHHYPKSVAEWCGRQSYVCEFDATNLHTVCHKRIIWIYDPPGRTSGELNGFPRAFKLLTILA